MAFDSSTVEEIWCTEKFIGNEAKQQECMKINRSGTDDACNLRVLFEVQFDIVQSKHIQCQQSVISWQIKKKRQYYRV